jgi:hypothetical protein
MTGTSLVIRDNGNYQLGKLSIARELGWLSLGLGAARGRPDPEKADDCKKAVLKV